MCGPPETRNRPEANRTAIRKERNQPDQTTEAASAYQAPSPLQLQVFCLARRFALNASLAEAFAVLVWGLQR
jgi:hypothetical protein